MAQLRQAVAFSPEYFANEQSSHAEAASLENEPWFSNQQNRYVS
jgi:hypothetical protein